MTGVQTCALPIFRNLECREVGLELLQYWLHHLRDFQPSEEVLRRLALERGYELARGSIAISYAEGHAEWRFVALALSKGRAAPLSELAAELTRFEGVENFNLSHARN